MSIVEIAIIAVLAAAVFFAVRRIVKMKKSGGCSCGCAGCSKACAMAHGKEAPSKTGR